MIRIVVTMPIVLIIRTHQNKAYSRNKTLINKVGKLNNLSAANQTLKMVRYKKAK